MIYDIVVVGAGFTGLVAAERLADKGKDVLVVEKRSHIGGNVYDCYNAEGILIHRYGPHIFHTFKKEVWEYLSRFTKWRTYTHHVLVSINGIKVPLPFNLNSIKALFPHALASGIEGKMIAKFGYGTRLSVLELMRHEDKDLRSLAEYIYNKIFLKYSVKQWGVAPEVLDPSVIDRVPVLIGRDDRYFQDPYQGIPLEGYNKMFEAMINMPNVTVMLNTDFHNLRDIQYRKMIYTGPIDYFFEYKHGMLPYRSLKFDFQTMDTEWFQDVAVVNYPDQPEFTRITEFKHLTGQKRKITTIAKEFPEAYQPGKNDPSYPVMKKENMMMYKKYKEDADKLKDVFFVGRLAEYKYYNMDEAVERALMSCEEIDGQ